MFAGTTPEPVDERGPFGKVRRAELGRVASYGVSGGAQLFSRSHRDVRSAGVDDLKLSVQLNGTGVVAQDDAVTVVRPGQLAIYDTGRPYSLHFEDAWSCAVMTVPRTAIGLRWQSVRGAMHRALPASSGIGRVLARFITTTVRECTTLSTPLAGYELGDAALTLFTATIADATASSRISPAQMLRAEILEYVRTNLADAQLTHAALAARFNLSARSLDRLFADEPFTLAEHIRALRLRAAHRDLLDPNLRPHTIAWLAGRWGFADAAHFSRSFKRAFGISPSEARRAAD